MTFPWATSELPWLTTAQMAEVDRAMIEDYGITLIQMMENAGRCLAHLARTRFLGGDPRGQEVTILAGKGGNGGGALVCARRLANYGAHVQVHLAVPEMGLGPVPAHQLAILRRMGLPVVGPEHLPESGGELVIDGLIGYSLNGAPRGATASLIRWANTHPAPILALDVPSGVDASTGTVHEPAIQATATLTLALPKFGLRASGVDARVGELYLADISVPPELYAIPSLGLAVGPIFAPGDILQIS